jgi:hypothetical protein
MSAEITVYPSRFTALFGLYYSHYSHQDFELLPWYSQFSYASLQIFLEHKIFELPSFEPTKVIIDP